MKVKILDLIDFDRVDILLEGFNKSTGFVTAILDLDGNVLSKSGWRHICTEFHRIHPETSKKCTISDTVLANKMEEGEKYHFYQCLNGLVDVAVPIVIKGEHIANLFSGQFFFEEPDSGFFKKQAGEYGFNEKNYLKSLGEVPVVSKEKALIAMEFLLNMTQLISEMTFQKLEQMELNEAIKASEIYNRMLFEQSAIGLALTSFDGRLVDINTTFAIIIGRTVEEAKALTYWDITPEKYQNQEQQQLDSLAKTGRYGPYEKEYIHKDGHLVPVRLQGLIIERNNEKFIWSSVEDISEQKKAELDLIAAKEEIEASERIKTDLLIKFNEAQHNAKIGNWDWDMVSNKVWWSDELYSIFDLDPNDFVPSVESNAKYVHPDDNVPYHNEVQRVIENKEELNTDLRIISGNGTLKYCNSKAKLEYNENGNPIRFYGTFADITERKQAENALRQSEEKFSIMFQKAPFSAALFSISDLKLVEVNEQFEKYWGYSSAEAIGKTSSELGLYPDDDEDARLSAIIEQKGFIYDVETKMRTKTGELKDVLINSDIVKIGNEQFVLSTVQNITERKKLDFERHKFVMLAESSSEFIGMCDLNLQPVYVNPSGIRMVGLTDLSEACRVKVQDYFFPEDQRFIAEDFFPRVMSEGHGDVEIRLRHFRTSEPIWVFYYLFRVCDSDGKPVGWATVSRDITESKLAEKKIKESSTLIRIAAEKAKLGGWNVDLKENRSYWSDEVAAIHEMPPGYAPLVEEGINFYAPEWHERIIKVFTECAENGVPYDEEMEIITSTGRRVWVRTIGEAVRDENGKIFKVQGAFQDISERKLAEAKSREKDLQFRKLSANVPDLIFQFTRKPDGTYCVPVASEGIKNIFGCSPEEVVDDFTPIGKVIYPDDAERVIADIENSAKNLSHFTCEFRVQIPGRPVQWILSRSTPEKLPDGSITWYGFNADITQRKEFEDALQESENKFRKIYEEGPFGMSLVNSDFKFIMSNRTFCEITGYSESELKKLTFRDITYPDDKDIGIESIKKLINGEIPVFKSEKRYVRKDGSVIWGAITVTANFDKNGNFLYNVSIVEDITDQKQAEQLLKASEENYRTIFEFSPVAAVFWDKEAKIIFWNRTAEQVFGWSKDEVIGRKFTEFFIPESSRKYVEENVDLLINNISRETTINENLKKDGTLILCEWTNTIVYDKDRKPATIISLAKDVTEQKRAEEKIKTLNERLQLLVEAVQELSISTSMESIMATVRTSARKLVNSDGSTFILLDGDYCYYADEETISPLWKGQRFPLTYCISGWAMLNKQPVIIEDIYADDRIPIEAYRSTFVRSLAIAPIRLSNPLGAIGAYWGSNYLPSEIEIKLLNTLADAAAKAVENVQLIEGLEQKISDRTSQLQAVNKELETFTYSVSHDLKAPLRGIDGYSKLLLDLYGNSLTEEAQSFISTIRSSTIQMNQLIEDLLEYSRLERSQLRNVKIRIRELISSITALYTNELETGNFTLKTEIPDIDLTADEKGLTIALRNLIDNALKFSTGKEHPTIEIDVKEDLSSWIIRVADNGTGFDMKYSQRIFEIFQRLHRSEDFPGTGIGLALVSKAMHRMQGKVWAESVPGEGSSFYLEIPKTK